MGFYEKRILPSLCARAVSSFDEERRQVLAGARGDVLEIGMGPGYNFKFYPPGVRRVFGLEYSAELLQKARTSREDLVKNKTPSTEFYLTRGSATDLYFKSNRFDTAVVFLVFCTLPDPLLSAREIFRVLKPGGRLIFYEHVLAESSGLQKWQNGLNPLWTRLSGGCNLNRDTLQTFIDAGFSIEKLDRFVRAESFRPSAPKIEGVAVKKMN